MNKIKKMAISGTMLLTMGITSFTPVLAEGSGVTNIDITKEATLVDITVSSSIPVTFKADGTNLIGNDWELTNHTPNVAVKVIGLEFKGQTIGDETYALLPNTASNVEKVKSHVDNTELIMSFDMQKTGTYLDASTKLVPNTVVKENESIQGSVKVDTRSASSKASTVEAGVVIIPTVDYNRQP